MANGPTCSMIILHIALFIILGGVVKRFLAKPGFVSGYVLMQTGTSVRVY